MKRFVCIISCVTLCGIQLYAQSKPTSPAKPVPAVPTSEGRIGALEKELNESKEDLKNAWEFAYELSSRISDLEHDSVTFDPASPGKYQRLDTGAGTLLVLLEEVQPYLDGVTVNLRFGNTSTITYEGFKLNVTWAPRYKKENYANYLAWTKTKKTKELSLTDVLAPRKWNEIKIILPDTKPAELGYLHFTIETDTVSFSRAP